jgi:hypothetical protein
MANPFPARAGAWSRRSAGTGAGPRVSILVLGLSVVAVAAGCASGEPVVETRPLDAGQLAERAERASALDSPYRLVFEWTFNEPGARMQGRGVARVEPPYRARVDLFNRSGDRITAAALVDGEMRVPEGLPDLLPRPTLLWGALGVFRPERRMGLAGGSWRRDGLAELRYAPGGGSEVLVRLLDSRVHEMVHQSNGQAVEDLRVQLVSGERFPREATYRNLRQTRELRMTLESVEHVESYPSDIWDPRR